MLNILISGKKYKTIGNLLVRVYFVDIPQEVNKQFFFEIELEFVIAAVVNSVCL